MNKLESLKTAVSYRNTEIEGYQTNIDNYTLMIAALPSTWPDDLAAFKGLDLAALVAAIADEAQLFLAADLVFHDRLVATLRTEKLEQRKAILVRDVIQKQVEVLTCMQ